MIEKNTVVTIEYIVTDPDDNVVGGGTEPMVYLHGGYGDIYPAIEKALDGKEVGDTVRVKLQPAEAFGEYDPDLVGIVAVADLPQPAQVGMQIEAGNDGEGNPVYHRVTDIAEGRAIVDGNHPLAGTALIFTCTVADARRASAQEIGERRRQ